MVDLILIAFFAAIFYAGFYLGGKYASVKAMLDAFVKYLSGLLKS